MGERVQKLLEGGGEGCNDEESMQPESTTKSCQREILGKTNGFPGARTKTRFQNKKRKEVGVVGSQIKPWGTQRRNSLQDGDAKDSCRPKERERR